MIEQEVIMPPWHPESEKPTLPFVICTNGEGHYWIGAYSCNNFWKVAISKHQGLYLWDSGSEFEDPLAWIEPEKFVPFVKKKELHHCDDKLDNCSDSYGPAFTSCWEEEDGTFWIGNAEYASQVSFCPVCGQKAGVEC